MAAKVEVVMAKTVAVDRSAIRPEDIVNASLSTFSKRVDGALASIGDAIERFGSKRVGVSFSGGKDSTVLLDLVRRVDPDAPVAFFDSGCELQSTIDLVRMVGAQIITPRMSMFDMARYSGWWGYRSPVDQGCPFDAKKIVIQEPSETFVVRNGLRVISYGLRAEESRGRKMNACKGELFLGRDRTYYLQPIVRWSVNDIWAYIASRELKYNRAYDVMAAAGIARESQRVATLLGDLGAGWGRHEFLRRTEPERFREISREFPGLELLT